MAKGDTTITVFNCKPEWGGIKKIIGSAVLDNYKTGGYTFDLSVFGLGTIKVVVIEQLLGHQYHYDSTNKKVIVYTTASTELADDSATLAASTLNFMAIGQGV